MKPKLTLVHLYPDNMNLYGDLGNIVTLMMRCQWRNINLEVKKVKIGDPANLKNADIIFLGGGQDRGQKNISQDLLIRRDEIREEIEKGLVALTICGGFQLFGQYFQTSEGDQIPGIGIFDCHTIADQKRLIGNVVVDIEKSVNEWHTEIDFPEYKGPEKTLVGFENHSGKTFLGSDCKPLGYLKIGLGNQGDGGYEGGVYKNAFGTYLHGSLLPKNPWFADFLITLAYYRRYKKEISLTKLNDTIEISAHQAAINRAETAKTLSI